MPNISISILQNTVVVNITSRNRILDANTIMSSVTTSTLGITDSAILVAVNIAAEIAMTTSFLVGDTLT